jgi:ParB family transcriptional regulator, chromosome partitioning protein
MHKLFTSNKESEEDVAHRPDPELIAAQSILYIDPENIQTNPYQPRQDFEGYKLEDLVASIKEHGILQPLVVTQEDDGFELVAGERRLRAAKKLNLAKVPVIVRTAGELEKLELSLIENIQRQDLNSMEKASSFRKLIDEFSLTHEQAAKRLGVSRAALTNTLRFLKLPDEIKQALASGRISEGQAKLLLELTDQDKQAQVFKKIVQQGWTVEDTRTEVGRVKVKPHIRSKSRGDSNLQIYEEVLAQALKTKVRVKKRGGKGKIEIEYYSEEELRNIIDQIKS